MQPVQQYQAIFSAGSFFDQSLGQFLDDGGATLVFHPLHRGRPAGRRSEAIGSFAQLQALERADMLTNWSFWLLCAPKHQPIPDDLVASAARMTEAPSSPPQIDAVFAAMADLAPWCAFNHGAWDGHTLRAFVSRDTALAERYALLRRRVRLSADFTIEPLGSTYSVSTGRLSQAASSAVLRDVMYADDPWFGRFADAVDLQRRGVYLAAEVDVALGVPEVEETSGLRTAEFEEIASLPATPDTPGRRRLWYTRSVEQLALLCRWSCQHGHVLTLLPADAPVEVLTAAMPSRLDDDYVRDPLWLECADWYLTCAKAEIPTDVLFGSRRTDLADLLLRDPSPAVQGRVMAYL